MFRKLEIAVFTIALALGTGTLGASCWAQEETNEVVEAVTAVPAAPAGNCGSCGESYLTGAYGSNSGRYCGRGYSQAQAAAMWSDYCVDDCGFYGGCADACKLKNLFRNRKSFGGFGCGGCDLGYGAPCGDAGCNTGCNQGCGCGGGLKGKFGSRCGGCNLGSRGGLFGNHGCDNGCGKPAPTCNQNCFDDCTGGGLLAGFGNKFGKCGCGNGLFSKSANRGCGGCGSCGGSFLSKFESCGCGNGCGGRLFGGKRCGGRLDKVGCCKRNGGFFSRFVGRDFGDCDFQSCVSGKLTNACGGCNASAAPTSVDEANDVPADSAAPTPADSQPEAVDAAEESN